MPQYGEDKVLIQYGCCHAFYKNIYSHRVHMEHEMGSQMSPAETRGHL